MEATSRGQPLIPVTLDAGIKPPMEYRVLNSADLSAWDRSAKHPEFARLLSSIRSHLGEPSGPNETPDPKDVVNKDEEEAENVAPYRSGGTAPASSTVILVHYLLWSFTIPLGLLLASFMIYALLN